MWCGWDVSKQGKDTGGPVTLQSPTGQDMINLGNFKTVKLNSYERAEVEMKKDEGPGHTENENMLNE